LGGLGSDLGSIILGGEISADATRALLSPKSSYESLAHSPSPVKGSVVPIPKRRVDWERDDDENPGDAVRHANPAKKLRTCEPSPNLHSGTKDMPDIPCLLLGGESLSAASLDLLHPSEDDRMPAPMMTAQELDTSQSSADSDHDPSTSDGFASPSPLSRWQAPRSSPLGPRTSPYCRRSKISPFPSILSSSFVKDHLVRNVVNEWVPFFLRHLLVLPDFHRLLSNVARDPYEQSAQWCEDLHALGLSETFHPTYICRHEYHPNDPEYDEEWSNETWSDEEWSDSEDTPPSPADEDQAESSVTIIRAEEQPQANNSETFTFVHWNNWRPSLPLPPHMLDIHPPLGSPWNASEGVGKEAKERRGDVFADTAELFPTA
jgi:hypothetical protein